MDLDHRALGCSSDCNIRGVPQKPGIQGLFWSGSQAGALANVHPIWIHFTKFPPLHACLCHSHPPPSFAESWFWRFFSQMLVITGPQTLQKPKRESGWESQNSAYLSCNIREEITLCSAICAVLGPMDTEALGFYLCQQETKQTRERKYEFILPWYLFPSWEDAQSSNLFPQWRLYFLFLWLPLVIVFFYLLT